ncbi:hypothetical protein B0H66DRAFT_535146 [Apodospora peruviana]|uniref:Glycosyl transferase family 25 domain-containing protein n=1 Tax=Apodospora peruviana TaxID=516989 RepID=A0AAE0I3G3_9PEZI|nr:hypothetical protein B0H66DRAFT_535146 [Apodospora peruviana]
MLLSYRSAVLGLTIFFVICFLLLKPTRLKGLSPFQNVRDSGKASPEISNATLGFQQVFVVNIPERTDRRDAMTLAAALSEIDVTWVDGVLGGDVTDRVLPADSWDKHISRGNKGSWRAHMNVLQTIIRQNLTSALILEDDADWDIRLKSQLQVFAQATRAFTQPAGTKPRPQDLLADIYNPPTTAEPDSSSSSSSTTIVELPLAQLLSSSNSLLPKVTPYGDIWDVLWLGHCGTDFPTSAQNTITSEQPSEDDKTTTAQPKKPLRRKGSWRPPLLRVPISNDMTVPEPQHLKPHPFALRDPLGGEYPPHTRVVHAAAGRTSCTQAYAVSQKGARKLLWQFGLQTFTSGWDLMLGDWCDGVYNDEDGEDGVKKGPVCVTVQPPLFSHHFGKGATSDIMSPGGGFIKGNKEMTPYVRFSVKMNTGRMVEGREPEDQWPDAV